ncbi:MAG: FUSC family protein [bacterium]|nr:FUSC family protein [bacterium]
MAIAETTRLPTQPSRLLEFLRAELAPLPGRGLGTVRIVVACVVTLVLCMALQVPEAHLAVWVALRTATEEAGETLLFGVLALLALTIGIAGSLLLLMVAMDQAWLRFCAMAALAALGLFLRRTFVIGALGFVIGLVGTLIMTVPDFVPDPELVVRASLWLWPVFALGIAASVAVNLLVAPSDPAALLAEELRLRVEAAEHALARRLGRAPTSDPTPLTELVTAGMARMLSLLRSAEIVHPSLARRHAAQSALVTLADRLVTAAVALELTAPDRLEPGERVRLERLVAACDELRRMLAGAPGAAPATRSLDLPPTDAPPGGPPAVVELERVVGLLAHTLASDDASLADAPPPEPRRAFVPDALTNPEYLRYAAKGALAVMICYVLQSAVDWPGIRTCIVTCMIVALTSQGGTIQKATLRLGGALVGALLGFLSILFLVPELESITSLALLVAAGTVLAAWVDLGSARISYAGVQIAFAFYVCVIQGFTPSWHFDTIRDRLVGILLGNVVITLVFLFVWPVDATRSLWRQLAAALRTTARLATVEDESEDPAAVGRATGALRAQADRQFGAVQQALAEAAFEVVLPGTGDAALRDQAQRRMTEAQALFLTQLAVARHRPDIAPRRLPPTLRTAVRNLNHAIAARVDAVADRLEGATTTPLPDVRAAFDALADVVEPLRGHRADPDLAAEAQARLALYRTLVLRVEQLGVPAPGAGVVR